MGFPLSSQRRSIYIREHMFLSLSAEGKLASERQFLYKLGESRFQGSPLVWWTPQSMQSEHLPLSHHPNREMEPGKTALLLAISKYWSDP